VVLAALPAAARRAGERLADDVAERGDAGRVAVERVLAGRAVSDRPAADRVPVDRVAVERVVDVVAVDGAADREVLARVVPSLLAVVVRAFDGMLRAPFRPGSGDSQLR